MFPANHPKEDTPVRMGKCCPTSGSLLISLIGLAVIALSAGAQTAAPNEWTWMGGSSTVGNYGGQPGVYGALGVPAATNIPGGRAGASNWTDSSGNFWLFGGLGYDSKVYSSAHFPPYLLDLNDLWEFNPLNQEWTWMGGSSVVNPGAGMPGIYGTRETPAAGNVPGGRYDAATWVDNSGNLWLFGGAGFDGNGTNGFLNDLWEFNPRTNEWAWMGGSSTEPPMYGGGQSGVYGTLRTPATGNIPGSRASATTWTDGSGNLWLFGGWGFDAKGNDGNLNDLWKFNPSRNEWAWMGGSSTVPKTSDGSGGQPGVYGTRGTPAAQNVPGGRQAANGWTDSNWNLWLFGGSSFGQFGDNNGYLNDLWEFSPATGEWTWMCGSDLPGDSGSTSEPCSDPTGPPRAGVVVPAARWLATSWTDGTGQFWLFGGKWGEDIASFKTTSGFSTLPRKNGPGRAAKTSTTHPTLAVCTARWVPLPQGMFPASETRPPAGLTRATIFGFSGGTAKVPRHRPRSRMLAGSTTFGCSVHRDHLSLALPCPHSA